MAFQRKRNNWIETGPPQDELLGWAAGFFDGEGCICAVAAVRRNRSNADYRLRVTVSQSEPTTLDRFRKAVGVRCAMQELDQRAGTNSSSFVVVYDGRQAYEVLRRLGPHLFRKAAEFRLAKRLWTEGCLGRRSGPNGWPDSVWKLRQSLTAQLSALKGRKARVPSQFNHPHQGGMQLL